MQKTDFIDRFSPISWFHCGFIAFIISVKYFTIKDIVWVHTVALFFFLINTTMKNSNLMLSRKVKQDGLTKQRRWKTKNFLIEFINTCVVSYYKRNSKRYSKWFCGWDNFSIFQEISFGRWSENFFFLKIISQLFAQEWF